MSKVWCLGIIQRLEETLNSKLFHRTTRSISLTEVRAKSCIRKRSKFNY
ncbi:LysR family transcriptional regulator [Vibrio chagasii]|nr:LysR family transcriptional regulator [Vibrio chagasii]